MTAATENALCFTFDLDWAPDFVLEDFRELLAEAGLPATLFCTHRSPAVERLLALPGCEAALHPNLLDAGDEAAALAGLHGDFPDAKGIRVHRLYYHSGLLPLLHARGLEYLSNELEMLRPGLAPRYDWSELVRLPIYWEDDVHCALLHDRFEAAALALASPGLKVLNFHPIHLYLNTERLEGYLAAKGDLRDEEALRARRRGGAGVRALFAALVVEARGRGAAPLGEVAAAFVAGAPRSERHRRFRALHGGGG